ncbi:MAG: hypothetical protein ACI9WU_003332, partial [Myxococcota bacterium]
RSEHDRVGVGVGVDSARGHGGFPERLDAYGASTR